MELDTQLQHHRIGRRTEQRKRSLWWIRELRGKRIGEYQSESELQFEFNCTGFVGQSFDQKPDGSLHGNGKFGCHWHSDWHRHVQGRQQETHDSQSELSRSGHLQYVVSCEGKPLDDGGLQRRQRKSRQYFGGRRANRQLSKRIGPPEFGGPIRLSKVSHPERQDPEKVKCNRPNISNI
jgi:hypothetical protein